MLLACLNLKRYPSLFLTKNNLVSLKKKKTANTRYEIQNKKGFSVRTHAKILKCPTLMCILTS